MYITLDNFPFDIQIACSDYFYRKVLSNKYFYLTSFVEKQRSASFKDFIKLFLLFGLDRTTVTVLDYIT